MLSLMFMIKANMKKALKNTVFSIFTCHITSVAISYAFCIQVFITVSCHYGPLSHLYRNIMHWIFCPAKTLCLLDWVPKDGEEHPPVLCSLCCSGVLGMLWCEEETKLCPGTLWRLLGFSCCS